MERLAERRMRKENFSLDKNSNYYQEDEEEEEEEDDDDEEVYFCLKKAFIYLI